MVLSPKTYTFLCGCFAALGSILFGYDLGVIAGVLPAPDFLRVMDLEDDPNGNWIGFISSSLLLGAFCGCIPASLAADMLSRRTAIFIGALWFILGGVLQTAAMNRGMMLAGRFIGGFAIGQLSFLAPLYQTEIAHPSNRGRLATLQQFFLGIGALIASFIVYALEVTQPGTVMQWRLPLGLQLFPCIPLASMIFLFPESPRWLMSVGREEDAIASLARLHAHGDIHDPFVVNEAAEIKAGVMYDKQAEQGWKKVLGDKSNLRRVFIGVMLQFSVQMTGVSCIQYYSPQIFAAIGFAKEKTFLFQSINSIIALIAQAICVFFCDRIGFRPLLIYCNLVSSATFAVGTALQAEFPADPNNPDATNTSASYAFVMMTWIFNFAFSLGIGPISWAVPPAIFTTGIRSKGTALSSMSAWIANFMIGQVSPKAFESIGWRYYVVFCILSFTNAIAMWALIPEVVGRDLESIDELLREEPWFIPRSAALRKKVKGTDVEDKIRNGEHPAPAAKLDGLEYDEKKEGTTTMVEHI